MSLQIEQLKTYSKKNPITPFASSAELVQKKKTQTVNTSSPESTEDCDKTLEVDYFDSTFDRLADGVTVPTPKKSFNKSTSYEISESSADGDLDTEEPKSTPVKLFEDIDSISEDSSVTEDKDTNPTSKFKLPKLPTRKPNLRERLLKRETLKINSRENVNLRKRKHEICYKEDDENQVLPKNKKSRVKENIETKECSVPITRINGTKNFNNLITSTPKGMKLRKRVCTESISPIQKSNQLDSDYEDDEAVPTSIMEKSIKKHCRPIYDIRVVLQKLPTCENLKNNDEESTSENEATLIKLKSKLSDIVNLHCSASINSCKDGRPSNIKIITESNEILIKPIDISEDVIIATVSTSRNVSSFVGTPSMSFDEPTRDNEIMQKNSYQSPKNAQKFDTQDVNSEANVLTDLSNSVACDSVATEENKFDESSYYPHDWTNDYESTSEYFGEKTNSSDKENEIEAHSSLQNQSYLINTKNLVNENSMNIHTSDTENLDLTGSSFKSISKEKEKSLATEVQEIRKSVQNSKSYEENSINLESSKVSSTNNTTDTSINIESELSEAQNNISRADSFQSPVETEPKESKFDKIYESEESYSKKIEFIDNSAENSCIQDMLDKIEKNDVVEKETLNDITIENKQPHKNKVTDGMSLENSDNTLIDENDTKLNTELVNTSDAEDEKKSYTINSGKVENTSKSFESTDIEDVTLSAVTDKKMCEAQNNVENPTNDDSREDQDLYHLLTKLKNPINITVNRNKYRNWKKQLDPIVEDQSANQTTQDNDNNVISTEKKSKFLSSHEDLIHLVEPPDGSADNGQKPKDKVIFLKPGKSWARSLSILNNFNNEEDIDKMSSNRGKSWRHSVQNILNMQPEGMKCAEVECDKTKAVEMQSLDARESKENTINRISSVPHNRSSRHFSMRIIPSGVSSINNYVDENKVNEGSVRVTRNSSFYNTESTASFRRHTSIIATEEDLINSAKDIILRRCCQTKSLPFNVVFPNSYLNCCQKIGEGVYGEVYLYENGTEKSVIKIIPIEGDQIVNSEPQKKFHEILSEVIITEELHKLRDGCVHSTSGFVGVITTKFIKGKYPKKLLQIWNNYDEEKESENDCPKMFGKDQLYIVLELVHGGKDLESYKFQNASESLSIFFQTALSLAVAEMSLEFEHRDLHWGNILISTTDDKNVRYKLCGSDVKVPSKGVKVSLIDFTLSRMSYQGCRIFNDLSADPTLFTAQGEYQFDIYRMMREKLNNDWQKYNPHTNILWLDYTLDKMINAVTYKRKSSNAHKTSIQLMADLRKEIHKYNSAFEFITKCDKIIGVTGLGNLI